MWRRESWLIRLGACCALAWHPAAHAQRVPAIVVAVLAALAVSPLLAVALKWATLRVLGTPARGAGLWLACLADGALWLAALPAAWALWDVHGLPASAVALLAVSTALHRWLVRPRDTSAAGTALSRWARSLLLAVETPLIGMLIAAIVWQAFFFSPPGPTIPR
ncbi:MAG: hypothetical protein R3286_13645 [Gammaproteobacteria bacterium]|nr:hypothetical protein [Gammaproteobacteria bacterium]